MGVKTPFHNGSFRELQDSFADRYSQVNIKRLMHFVQMVLNFDKMSRQINHGLQDADGI